MKAPSYQTMKRTMSKLKGLVDEARNRTVLWAIFVGGLACILSRTSSSVWLNVPVTAAVLVALRYLSFELEIRKKIHPSTGPSHVAHLLKTGLVSDDLLITPSVPTHWRRKIDSPIIEEALDDFTRHIVEEFVTNSWYSALSPDRDVPEQIRLLVMDILGELGQRLKRINLVNLLTRDMIEVLGNHLELFRQAKRSIRRFESLSVEDREKELRLALSKGNQLHPALSLPDGEIKVLQQFMGGMIAIVLRPQDAQCVLMRGLARELLACAVLRPVINFASPGFINKSIEGAIASAKAKTEVKATEVISGSTQLNAVSSTASNRSSAIRYGPDAAARVRQEDRGKLFDIASERKSRTPAAENLDILQAKSQDYKNRDVEKASTKKNSAVISVQTNDLQPAVKDVTVRRSTTKPIKAGESGLSTLMQPPPASRDIGRASQFTTVDKRPVTTSNSWRGDHSSQTKEVNAVSLDSSLLPVTRQGGVEKPGADIKRTGSQHRLSQSSGTGPDACQKLEPANPASKFSTLDYWDSPGMQMSVGGNLQEAGWSSESTGRAGQNVESLSASTLNCWVIGAHLEKAASKTFAVYSIAVTDTDNKTWFVERRFRNFEQLHRKLRDLPQYNLQLPPKRFLSSSLDETFVRDRCILLDKYLKDLLSIPSIAELHEVWDFLSVTSKNYAHSKSPSVMKTLAVNVDDAVDDMFRQLRGVSDGLLRRVGGPSSDDYDGTQMMPGDGEKPSIVPEATSSSIQIDKDKGDIYSDEDLVEYSTTPGDAANSMDNWPSDNDLHDTTGNGVLLQSLPSVDKNANWLEKRIDRGGSDSFSVDESTTGSDSCEEDTAVPPEWTPPKLTKPLLTLVELIFELQDQDWIRCQVYWTAKQILHLGMGDAVDDWLLNQIQQLRQENVIAGYITSLQEILWPGGIFITKVQQGDNSATSSTGSTSKFVKQASRRLIEQSTSFESQLEAARCAKAVHDCLVEGAPQALVRFVGKQQYTKSAKDIYYFLQSSLFLKQLFFSILETLLVTIFPEMSRLILDIRYQGV